MGRQPRDTHFRTESLPGPPRLVLDVHRPAGPHVGAAIWIHGFGSRRDGEKVAHAGGRLGAAGWTLLAPDLQGHGDSGGDFAHLTIERSMHDVARVAARPEYADAPRRALVGSSFGGLVAAWLAAERPALCDRLVLLAPAFGFVERHAAALPAATRAAWRAGELLRVPRDGGEVVLAPDILHEAARRPVAALARRLAVPTLILHGARDEQVPLAASRRFAAACPAPVVRLEVLEGGDHRLLAHKERWADAVVEFLGSIP